MELIATEGSISSVARRVGTSAQYLWQIVNGYQGAKDVNPRSVGDKLADQIERAYNKPKGWLDATDEVVELRVLQLEGGSSSDAVFIPLLSPGQRPGTGGDSPMTGIGYAEDALRKMIPTMTSPANLVAVEMAGDAMSPTLSAGDHVYVDTGMRQAGEAIYLVAVGGLPPMIRRLQVRPDGAVRVIADNSRYETYTVAPGEPLEILGRAIHAMRSTHI